MPAPNSHPLLIVISAPSGGGKTTLCKRLLAEKKSELTRIVTCTTRDPRKDEADGDDYFFLDADLF